VSDDIKSETNRKKSEGVRKRWDKRDEELLKNDGDRNSKKFNYTCFDNLRLSNMQKQFVVIYMNPPYFGNRENRYTAYKEVFNPTSDNSMRSNCSALLSKTKIKEAILAYQKDALKAHKIEVTTESIENYRKRANYKITTFFNDDGSCKPLNDIPQEWLICIDSIKKDKKANAGKAVIEVLEYKLCDRDKAMDKLQKMLGVTQTPETLQVSVPVSEVKDAIGSIGESANSGPRISLNMTVGNTPIKQGV